MSAVLDVFVGHCKYMVNIAEQSPGSGNSQTSLARVQVKAHRTDILTVQESFKTCRNEESFLFRNHEDGTRYERRGKTEMSPVLLEYSASVQRSAISTIYTFHGLLSKLKMFHCLPKGCRATNPGYQVGGRGVHAAHAKPPSLFYSFKQNTLCNSASSYPSSKLHHLPLTRNLPNGDAQVDQTEYWMPWKRRVFAML